MCPCFIDILGHHQVCVCILQMTATAGMSVSIATAVPAQGLGRETTTISPPSHGTETTRDDRFLALLHARGTLAAVVKRVKGGTPHSLSLHPRTVLSLTEHILTIHPPV